MAMNDGIMYENKTPTFMTRSSMALSAAFASVLIAKNAAIRTLSSPEDQTSRHCCKCLPNYREIVQSSKQPYLEVGLDCFPTRGNIR